MMEIRIKPTKCLYQKEDFYIWSAEVNPDDSENVELNNYGNISFKGEMPKLNNNEEYTVTLKKDTKGNYKGSYTLISIKAKRLETVAEQRTFLGTILTPNQVQNIYEVYDEKDDVIGMIEKDEFDFTKVKGVASKTYEKLKTKVMENIDMNEVLTFLSKYDIKYNMIKKLVKEYKSPQLVIEKIESNPYILTEVKGIGFVKADEIAKSVGYSMTSPNRINACLTYVIGSENKNGHSWIDFKQLLNKTVTLLNIENKHIKTQIKEAVRSGTIIHDNERYTMMPVYNAENYVAMKMTQLKTRSKNMFIKEELDEYLDEYCEKNGVELEENQRQFFHDWNENSVSMLVGGGGMGKSWLQRIVLELVDSKNLRTALLAPTGKASKVMASYTGRQASTIHRKAGVFGSDEEGVKEISEDVIIVDEASMCDIFILAKLFKAISNENVRLLFVGDDFQLPSVGVGNFLYDIIHSQEIKVSRLKKVFRQADGGILDIATKVREGKVFLNDSAEGRIQFGRDCVFWLTDQDYILDGVISNYKKVLKRFDQDDVAILTPTNKGKLGTVELNKKIQKIANPASPNKKEKAVGAKGYETIFRVGDSVMNVVNTYDIETVEGGLADIFNGDTGKIIDIDDENSVFIVDIDDIQVKMKFNTILTNLVHSWVTTIHKSQGSQYKVVILIADKSMTYQLNANLLYTGLSRAKEYLLVLCQAVAINRAIKKFANMERRSFMQDFLEKFNKDATDSIDDYEEENDQEDEDYAV